MQMQWTDGYTPGTKVLQLRSSQVFDRPVADLLLDVRTASGQQRYQVSLLTQAGPESMAAHSSSALRGSGQQTGMQQAAQKSINVRPRSEEHTSELQSLMRILYVVFCLKTNNQDRKLIFIFN